MSLRWIKAGSPWSKLMMNTCSARGVPAVADNGVQTASTPSSNSQKYGFDRFRMTFITEISGALNHKTFRDEIKFKAVAGLAVSGPAKNFYQPPVRSWFR